MKENRTLILITGHFPYDFFEGYLEEEIFHLSEKFKKIIIISQNTKANNVRFLPPNCIVYRVDTTLIKIELILRSLLAIKHKEFYNDLFYYFKTSGKLPNKKIIADLITTIISGKKIFSLITKIIKIEKLKKEDVLLYSYWFDKCAYAVVKALQKNKALIGISRAHSYDIYLWRTQNNYLPLQTFMLDKITAIYFISNHGKNYFQTLYKDQTTNSIKLKINKLGTNNNNYQYIDKSVTNDFILLSCSNISKLKRIDLIIKSLALIEKIKIKWVHIGFGWKNEQYENEIKELADKYLKYKINVKYEFTGKFKYEELLNFYAKNKIDLFINLSETEGLPVSIMEAMSFGIPVLATSVGGTSEIVNNENGLLLSANPSSYEVANAIVKIYNLNKEDKIKLNYNSYNTWKKDYNATINYKKFVEEIIKL